MFEAQANVLFQSSETIALSKIQLVIVHVGPDRSVRTQLIELVGPGVSGLLRFFAGREMTAENTSSDDQKK
jgi:hypothetical protein